MAKKSLGIVSIYSGGESTTIDRVENITTFDHNNVIKIRYRDENNKLLVVQTNMPYLYYMGPEE